MAKMVFDQDVNIFWLASVIYLKSRISYYCCCYYLDKSDLGNHVDLQEDEGIFSWMFLCLCANFALLSLETAVEVEKLENTSIMCSL